jgi:O-antigen ligase
MVAKNKKIPFVPWLLAPIVTIIFDVRVNDPFNVPKMLLLLVLAAWIIFDVIESNLITNRFTVERLGKLLGLSVFLFISFQTIVLFTHGGGVISLFGESQRRNGYLTYFGLAIFWFVIASLSNISSIRYFYNSMLVTAIIVLTYSIIQISGNDFIDWVNPYNNAIATLGNPNFTSAFLALVAVSSVVNFLSNKRNKLSGIFSLSIFTLSIFVIIQSDSRQGLYALTMGIIIYLNFWLFLTRNKLRFFTIILTLFLTSLSIAGMLQKGPLTEFLYKPSVSVRGYYWRAGYEMFLANPINGVGLDKYGYAFRQYKEIGYVQNFGSELTSTNAHNTFIQMFATGGFFVGISYICLTILTILIAIKFLKIEKSKEHRQKMLGLLGIYLTYQAQSMVSIDNIGLSVWNWLTSGLILGISTSNNSLGARNSLISQSKRVNLTIIKPILRFILVVPIFLLAITLYRAESDTYILRGISNPSIPSNKENVYRYAMRVINNKTADPMIKVKSTLFLADMSFIREGYEELLKLNKSDPENFDILWSLAVFQENINLPKEAIDTRLRIMRIDRYNTGNYLNLVKNYLNLNNRSRAEFYHQMLLNIDSKSLDALASTKLLNNS